jgi:hypothetical protein
MTLDELVEALLELKSRSAGAAIAHITDVLDDAPSFDGEHVHLSLVPHYRTEDDDDA